MSANPDTPGVDELVGFCAAQQDHFDLGAWNTFAEGRRAHLALAAFFLAATGWYGHEEHLFSLAESLHPGAGDNFAEQSERLGFNYSLFAELLKREILHARDA